MIQFFGFRNNWEQFKLIFLCLAIAGIPSSFAAGQEPADSAPMSTAPASGLIRFAGLVQYVKGTADRIESSQSRTPLSFQMPLYEGERLQVAPGSTLKIVTRSGCTAVFYEQSRVVTPHVDKPWRVRAKALRWICPEGSGEKVELGPALLQIDAQSGGEFVLNDSRLLVLRGSVNSQVAEKGQPQALPNHRLLEFRDPKTPGAPTAQWVSVEPEPSPYETWLFNEQLDSPKESQVLEKPDRPITSRWILTPVIGRGQIQYDQSGLNQKDLNGDGARIQMQHRWNAGSLIVAIAFWGLRDKSRQSSPGNPPPPGASSEIESFVLDAGYRFSHDRWWSPYFRAGLSVDKAKVQISRPDINYYSHSEYPFYSLTGSFGIDAMYRPRWLNWFGLYAAAEAFLTQSLGRGARSNLDNNNWYTGPLPSEANEPWRLTEFGARIMLGTMLQF